MASLRLCLIILLIKCVIGQDNNSTVSSDQELDQVVGTEPTTPTENKTVEEGKSVILQCLNTTNPKYCSFEHTSGQNCHLGEINQTQYCDGKRLELDWTSLVQ